MEILKKNTNLLQKTLKLNLKGKFIKKKYNLYNVTL